MGFTHGKYSWKIVITQYLSTYHILGFMLLCMGVYSQELVNKCDRFPDSVTSYDSRPKDPSLDFRFRPVFHLARSRMLLSNIYIDFLGEFGCESGTKEGG